MSSNCASNFQDTPYLRSSQSYPQDNVSVIRPTHKYMGQITESVIKPSSNWSKKSVRTVDDAVVIESVDDKTRQVAQDYFTDCTKNASHEKAIHKTEVNKGIGATVCGVSLSAGAGYCLAASVLSLTFAAPAIIGGIAATILGIRQIRHNQKAIDGIQEDISSLKRKKDQWNDPIDSIIDQRRRAGTDGFVYVFDNLLKNKSIHPEEVNALWLRDFSRMLSNHSSISKVFSDDLLGKKRLDYAWDGRPLPDLDITNQRYSSSLLNTMATRYQECRKAYYQFEDHIHSELRDIDRNRSSLLNEINSMRSRWTQPAYRLYYNGLHEAELLYNNALAVCTREKDVAIAEYRKAFHYVIKNPQNADEVAYKSRLDSLCCDAIAAVEKEYLNNSHAIEQAYERDRRMCTFLYNQAKVVVDSFFDNRVRQLDSEVAQARNLVEQQRQNGHQHFTNLLDRILHPSSELALIQQSISQPLSIRNWRLSNLALEPSWNDVYGQLPRFQPAFSSDISENVWNLFWGNNGLGRYAASPINSWSQLDSDRSFFPYQRGWLNLHQTPQPRERMFCRPVIVPPPPTFTQQRCEPVRPPVCPPVCRETPPVRRPPEPTCPAPTKTRVVVPTNTTPPQEPRPVPRPLPRTSQTRVPVGTEKDRPDHGVCVDVAKPGPERQDTHVRRVAVGSTTRR